MLTREGGMFMILIVRLMPREATPLFKGHTAKQ